MQSLREVYPRLRAVARRHTRSREEADDVVQQALVVAMEAGRSDFGSGQTRAWLTGVIRNQARMSARGAGRRQQREDDWSLNAPTPCEVTDAPDMSGLPPSLRLTALLALNGATRAEIGWLLGLTDTALRQRISQLRRALEREGVPDLDLKGGLAFGVLRQNMRRRLALGGGFLASHDPDGHIFVLASSQKLPARQHQGEPA